jgi:hypothetical protein
MSKAVSDFPTIYGRQPQPQTPDRHNTVPKQGVLNFTVTHAQWRCTLVRPITVLYDLKNDRLV